MHSRLHALALVLTGLTALAAPASTQGHTLEGGVSLAWEALHDGLMSQTDSPAAIATYGNRIYAAGTLAGVGDGVFLVVAYDATTGAILWTAKHSGLVGAADGAADLAVSPDGTALYVTGTVDQYIYPPGTPRVHTIRLDAATGAETWSATYADPLGVAAHARSLAVSPDGASIAVLGMLGDFQTGSLFDLVAVVYESATGSLRWTATYDGGGFDMPRDVAFTASGQFVIALGSTFRMGSGGDYLTLAYHSSTGSQAWAQWHTSAATGSGANDAPTRLAVSPTGNVLVVTGESPQADDTVAYDPATGALLWTSPFSGESGEAVVTSPDGFRVYVTGILENTASSDDDIRTACLDSATGAVLWEATYDAPVAGWNNDRPTGIEVTPDGMGVLISATSSSGNSTTDYATVGYNVFTGAELWSARYDGPGQTTDETVGVVVTDDGSRAVVTGRSWGLNTLADLTTIAYDPTNGMQLWLSRYDEPISGKDEARDIAVSPDGSRLFTANSLSGNGSWSETVAYDAATGSVLWSERFKAGNTSSEGGEVVQVSPDGNRVFVGIQNKNEFEIRAYAAQDGYLLWSSTQAGYYNFPERGHEFATSLDGSRLFVGYSRSDQAGFAGRNYATLALDSYTGAELWDVDFDGNQDEDTPFGLALSPDGQTVVVTGESRLQVFGGLDAVTVAYDALTGDARWVARYDDGLGTGSMLNERGSDIAFSPDGQRLYVAGRSAFAPGLIERVLVIAYDVATGAELWDAQPQYGTPGGPSSARFIRVAPDGSRVYIGGEADYAATGNIQGDVFVAALDAQSGTTVWTTIHDSSLRDEIADLELDPDGQTLFVSGTSGAAKTSFLPTGGDIFALGLDTAAGAKLWSADYAGAKGEDQARASVLHTSTRRFYLAGHSDQVAASWDATLFAYEVPSLVVDEPGVSLSAGGTQVLGLRPGSAFAGNFHWLLGSEAGTTPGIDLGEHVLPLNPGAYLTLTLLAPNLPPLSGSLGTLDAAGQASAAFSLPAGTDPALAGVVLHHAFVALDFSSPVPAISLASNAVAVKLLP